MSIFTQRQRELSIAYRCTKKKFSMEFITDIKNLLLKLHPRENFLRKKFSGNSILCWDQKVHPESVMSKYEIIFYWYGIQILKAQTNIKTKCFLPNEIKSVRKNALKVACSFSIFVDLEMDNNIIAFTCVRPFISDIAFGIR